jgi:hypothetical protein
MTAGRHVVRVVQMPRRDADPRSAWARWTCTCGRRSKLFGYVGHAERAGQNHALATGGWLDQDPTGAAA